MNDNSLNEPRVVVSTFPLSARSRERLEKHFDVLANDATDVWTSERYEAALARATALIAFMPDRIDEAALERAPHLRFISCALKGTDNFDLVACERRGIGVARVEDLLTAPTAELAIALAVSAGRHLIAADAHVRAGAFVGWRPTFYGTGFADSTVGIVGFGAIGQAIAQRLRGWSASVRYWDAVRAAPDVEAAHGVAFADRELLLRTADFVFLALPLTNETFATIDRARLATMKASAILVNVARGSLVDEVAVADALAAGRLGGYAADVFAFEDWLLETRPASIEPRLLSDTARTAFSPHLGSAVTSVRAAIEERAVTNVLSYFGYAEFGTADDHTVIEIPR